jgi:hypothetical protein
VISCLKKHRQIFQNPPLEQINHENVAAIIDCFGKPHDAALSFTHACLPSNTMASCLMVLTPRAINAAA